MTHTLTVSIGRSIPGDSPEAALDGLAWSHFREDLLARVTFWADRSGVLFSGTGVGTWTDLETGGVQLEDSYTVVFQLESLEWIAGLRTDLRSLAAAYQQQAIALTIGSTDLVPAFQHEPF